MDILHLYLLELERSNVKDQLGKPLSARIEDALIY